MLILLLIHILKVPISIKFFLKPVKEKEIIDIALSFKNGKSPGYDTIDGQIIKRAIHNFMQTFVQYFNTCFEKGVFLTQVKYQR